MLERLRVLGALAGVTDDFLTLSDVARMSGISEDVVTCLLEEMPFVNRRQVTVDPDGDATLITYAVPSGWRQHLLDELAAAFEATEKGMLSPDGAITSMTPDLPLGLVSAEDALRLELGEARSIAGTWTILERIAMDLELAEAGLPNVDSEKREAVRARVEAAKAQLDEQVRDAALEENLENIGSEFGVRTLVHWTADDHLLRPEPALLYVDALEARETDRWDLSHLVGVVRDHLHLIPKYVNLGKMHRPSRPPAVRAQGRGVELASSSHGVFVFVRIDSAMGLASSAIVLGRELERLHSLENSRCVVLDTHFDAGIGNMVLHNNGIYHGGAGTLDDLAFFNLTKIALDLVWPRQVSVSKRKTRAEAY